MKASYPVNRISVTDKIRDVVFNLIIEENDIEVKKKHPAKWYRNETASHLKLAEVENPSLRSYEDLVIKIRTYLKKRNPLDEPWSFGSLVNYPIPRDIILDIWRMCENIRTGGPLTNVTRKTGEVEPVQFYNVFNKKELTIREARWYSILISIPMGFEDNPVMNDPEMHRRAALAVAHIYAKYERQCELLNRYPNTIDFDSDTLEKINDKIFNILPILQKNEELFSRRTME
jgi:hypothetical protein